MGGAAMGRVRGHRRRFVSHRAAADLSHSAVEHDDGHQPARRVSLTLRAGSICPRRGPATSRPRSTFVELAHEDEHFIFRGHPSENGARVTETVTRARARVTGSVARVFVQAAPARLLDLSFGAVGRKGARAARSKG